MNRKAFLKFLGISPLLFGMKNLQDLKSFGDDLKASEKMPALFLGHGSPMNAIEENEFVSGFRKVAKSFAKPKAIICISAHWFTKGTLVTAMEKPKTIHDFGGFPKALYDVEYPAKGSPDLAARTKEMLLPTEVDLDEKWGFDHGSWSVIKHLYPTADVPLIQLSIDFTKPPSYHFELGKKLASLREKGILIVGSGNIIHNLGLADFRNMDKDNYGYDWAKEAHEKVNSYLLNGNFKPLMEYEKLGKALQLAVPTPEHFLPLLYALGLQEKGEKLSLFNDKLQAGSLSMTSVKIS